MYHLISSHPDLTKPSNGTFSAKLESSDNKAPTCFTPFLIGNRQMLAYLDSAVHLIQIHFY